MSMTIQVKLPGSITPESVEVDPDETAGDGLKSIAKKLNLSKMLNVTDTTLVVSPTAKRNGSIIAPHVKFSAIMFNPRDDVLELWREPRLMNCALFIKENPNARASIRDKRMIPIDFSLALHHMISVFQRVLALQPDLEFCFYYADSADDNGNVKGGRWLNSNLSLKEQDVLTEGMLFCYPISKLLKTPESQVKVTLKGWLQKRSYKKDHNSAKQRRLFVLSDSFLFYFRKENEKPAGVIPIEYYSVSRRLKKRKHQIFLNRAPTEPFKGMTDAFKLQCDNAELHDQWYNAFASHCINANHKTVFGQDLKEVLARKNSRSKYVPNVVRDCISYLDQHGLKVTGIFRISASATVVEYYQGLYDSGVDVSFDSCEDPHIPANLLKLYLRELPEPLLPFHLYDEFMRLSDPRTPDFASKIGDILTQLPPENYAVAKVLFAFLYRVHENLDDNKMSAENLATVFAPNLFRARMDASDDAASTTASLQRYGVINIICKEIIVRWDEIFRHAESMVPALAQVTQSIQVTPAGAAPSPGRLPAGTSAAQTSLAPGFLGELKGSLKGSNKPAPSPPEVGSRRPKPPVVARRGNTASAMRESGGPRDSAALHNSGDQRASVRGPPVPPKQMSGKFRPTVLRSSMETNAVGEKSLEDLYDRLQEEIEARQSLEAKLEVALSRIAALERK